MKKNRHNGGTRQNIPKACELEKSNLYEEKFNIVEAQNKMY